MPTTGAQTTQTISVDGGSLSLDGVTLTFPPGALLWDQPITISKTICAPNYAPPVTPVYQFAPEGLVFAQPVQVAMNLPASPGLGGLLWTTPFGDFVPTALSAGGSAVTASVTHFSGGYGFMVAPGGAATQLVVKSLPSSVDPGATATLQVVLPQAQAWEAGSISCSVDNGVGNVPIQFYPDQQAWAGLVDVAVQQTTTFTVTCTGPNGLAGKVSETVTVNQPPILTFSVTPNGSSVGTTPWPIAPGGAVDLTWQGRNLTTCFLGDYGPPVGISGTAPRNPQRTTTYTLTCTGGPNGYERRTGTATVCVNEGGNCGPQNPCCDPLACALNQCKKVSTLASISASKYFPAHWFDSTNPWLLVARDKNGNIVYDPALHWDSANMQVETFKKDPQTAADIEVTDVALGSNTITVTQPSTDASVSVSALVLFPTYYGAPLTFTPDACWNQAVGLETNGPAPTSYTVGVQGPPESLDAGGIENLAVTIASAGTLTGSWAGSSSTGTLNYTLQWDTGVTQGQWRVTMTMIGTFKPGQYLHSSGTLTWAVSGPPTTPCNGSSAYSW